MLKRERTKYNKQYYTDHKCEFKERDKQRYLDNIEEFREHDKKYYNENKDIVLLRHKKYKLLNKDKIKLSDGKKRLRVKYGITKNQFNQMKLDQNNCCAIHGEEFKNSKDTCVDHIHNSNPIIVRGLLCHNCNIAIGLCKDDINIIQRLINYLKMSINNGIYGRKKTKYRERVRQKLLMEQDNQCFICNNKFKNINDCHMDHEHKTKIIRKLLCKNCNTALGHFKEDTVIMEKAVSYLKNFK